MGTSVRALSAFVALAVTGCGCEVARRAPPTTARAPLPHPRPHAPPPPPPHVDEPVADERDRSPIVAGFDTRVIGRVSPPPVDSSVAGSSGPGGRIDLNLNGVDIADVCRLLADVGRVNIVLADDVRGAVTVRMKRVPWASALDAILRAKGFRAEREADVIIVYPR